MPDSHSDCTQILLVEDDKLVANTLAEALAAHGYAVRVAGCAEDARDLLAAERFHLAILDERLPGMSGLDLAAIMRDRYALPLIFLTAFADPERVQCAIDRGALAYLLKPVDVDQLLPALRTALARAEELRLLRHNGHHLQRALDERREISIAVGILMERLQIERQHAFETLRKTARAQRRRIEDVARDMLMPLSGQGPHAEGGN
ncbi:MAG: response regulator [Methyloversatilis sp.]|nr:response regulator [Methyloversatilis sp.]MBP6194423.1 response regulator [Methyloversatilis sp.]MBP9117168.1 response regulator [Methyloversatilis sp.]